ncbi:hypothetical protein [Luteolibacter luteus]|uniref:Uncharacterized protein n=1 Tax=Luteolibacter luteus TaxID=2728835 RepID=A0A858RHW2_9BACT|nr:hypothetical protein [Luteolibacter luteus]QJE96432.1 hypothetical protein HHL09_11775 [Luteolibacter luteus]
MNAITLTKKQLAPYQALEGSVSWQLDKEPGNLELRLFWFTRGRGDEESDIIETLSLGNQSTGQRSFSFNLPGWPWSVDGALVSIVWAVELVEGRGAGLALEEFVMGPGGNGTRLRPIENSKSEGKLAGKLRRLSQKPR